MDERFQSLFDKYNDQLKPLVAQIEGRFEKFETPLLENLMAYWECIVQMHIPGCENDEGLMVKANEKLDESISQSYVYMISAYQDEAQRFENYTSKQTRVCFDGGKFLGKYDRLKKEAERNVKRTNKTRHRKWNLKYSYPDFIKSYQWNKDAYEAYRQISAMINEQNTASLLYKSIASSTWWSLLGWVGGIAISVLLGMYIKTLIGWGLQWL